MSNYTHQVTKYSYRQYAGEEWTQVEWSFYGLDMDKFTIFAAIGVRFFVVRHIYPVWSVQIGTLHTV